MEDIMNQRLSQVLGGLADTGKMFHLASKLIKNKDAKTMLNLMAMTTGAAATTKDPMALMEAMQGPASDIASSMTEEQKQKRISDVMPPVREQPIDTYNAPMRPMMKMEWMRNPKNFPDRSATTPTEQEIARRLGSEY